ncbi:MAG: hypothetical protein ACYC3X_05435 [Pirellulaceae bacterium]
MRHSLIPTAMLAPVAIASVQYDVPYYAYQDKIISFAVVAYVCLTLEIRPCRLDR